MINLTLPYPISSNRYWRPVRIGAAITIVPTKDAKAYKAEVQRRARVAGIKAPITGRVRLVARLYPHKPLDSAKRMRDHGDAWDDTVQCLDLDNALKVAIDAIKNVVIDDDKWIRSIAAERMEPDGEARLVLEVHPIEMKRVQAALELDDVLADNQVRSLVQRAREIDPFMEPVR